MAWGVLPKPGTDYGPCAEPHPFEARPFAYEPRFCARCDRREDLHACGHTDCKLTRDAATGPCPFCGQPIGYETPFYNTDRGVEHAFCAGEEAAQERMAR